MAWNCIAYFIYLLSYLASSYYFRIGGLGLGAIYPIEALSTGTSKGPVNTFYPGRLGGGSGQSRPKGNLDQTPKILRIPRK